MNIELASYLGLVGSGLTIAALFGLTLIGILFVRLLDGIERYCSAIKPKGLDEPPPGVTDCSRAYSARLTRN